ncbi:MAG: transaldolase family protein [bacterium]
MRRSAEQGVEFWNDSCAANELGEAITRGARGATSNPVIVYTAVKQDPATWTPFLDALVAAHPEDSEDDLAWRLIEELGRRAAALLEPVHRETGGRQGFLSMQVNPKLYRSASRMEEHARILAAVAPNVAIKVPATPPGIAAGSALVASGINVNATVSFTLPQALAVAEAFEGAIDRALAAGHPKERIHPYVTLMVGRLDDHLQRVMAKDAISIDPGHLHWAGIAVFKKARRLFQERGYRSTLLAAAYRHHLHWSQLIGPGIVQSIPYAWWKQFEASIVEVEATLDRPVEPRILDALYGHFAEFRRAYDENGLAPEEFVHYGATLHTLQQFICGYHDLLSIVRDRMLR